MLISDALSTVYDQKRTIYRLRINITEIQKRAGKPLFFRFPVQMSPIRTQRVLRCS